MKKWEYLILRMAPMSTDYKLNINIYGKNGWELVSVHSLDGDWVQVYFKRKLLSRVRIRDVD